MCIVVHWSTLKTRCKRLITRPLSLDCLVPVLHGQHAGVAIVTWRARESLVAIVMWPARESLVAIGMWRARESLSESSPGRAARHKVHGAESQMNIEDAYGMAPGATLRPLIAWWQYADKTDVINIVYASTVFIHA